MIKKFFRSVLGVLPYETRFGPEYRRMYHFLQKSQWWSKEQQEEYQMQQIIQLLKHAYENVPYYHKLFSDLGIKPNAIQNFNDFKKIPFLTKEILQANLNDLVARNFNKNSIEYVTTGGSTGIPVGFYENREVKVYEWAFMTKMWSEVGYQIYKRNRCVILRGTMPSKGIFEYNGLNLILSSYYLTPEYMDKYIELIEDFNPDFIRAYPSAITILAEYLDEKGIVLKTPMLKAVLCGSENLYDYQRKKIESIFNTRVFSWYGHSERSCLAGECKLSNMYHIFSEYGYTELLSSEGKEVSQEDELGEIVCTGFLNQIVPFIRYKTMDLAVNTNAQCSCGRNYKIIKRIEGRLQEFLVTSTERYISMTAINMHSDVFDNVKQFQFYQDTPGKCTLNIIPKPTYSTQDESYIYQELMKKLGCDMELDIKIVDIIPRTQLGKYRFLIQKIPLKFGNVEVL